MRAINRPTDVVLPFDDFETPASDEPEHSELDWCFEDAELTMQLRAVKRGRAWVVTMLLGCVAAVGAGIALIA